MCRAAIQRDHHSEGPGQAGEMAWQQPYKIQPGQTRRLHLEQTNPLQWYGLRTGRLAGLQLCWKGLKESRGKWTKCGEQYSLTLMKASSVLACVNKSIAVDQAKWLFLFTSHFLDNMCNAVSNTLMQEGCCCRQRAIKMTGNCSTWLVRRRWENWACFASRRESFEGDVIATSQCLWGDLWEEGARFFTNEQVCDGKMRLKLNQGRFWLNMRKFFLCKDSQALEPIVQGPLAVSIFRFLFEGMMG